MAKLTSAYQVSIPKVVRDRMAWRPGQRITFVATSEGVLLIPIPGGSEEAAAPPRRSTTPTGRRRGRPPKQKS
jgi:AbrB family looped-hinge helix DNA binding protein